MKLSLISNCPDKTKEIAMMLGKRLKGGEVIGLSGELGAGKTTFVQGLSLGLGIGEDQYVRSPTFTLINEYMGIIPLYHFDLYRLESSEEMENLGYEEYFWGKGVSVIEWYEKMGELLPKDVIILNIRILGQLERKLDFSGKGIYYMQILNGLRKDLKD